MTDPKATAQKPALPPIEGMGVFTNLVAPICNFVLSIQDATGKVWRTTEGLHWASRVILTAPVGVVSFFGACLLGPVVMLIYAAALWLDLAYLDTKAWLKLNGGLSLAAFFIWLLWSFASSGPLGFVMAAVFLVWVSAQFKA